MAELDNGQPVFSGSPTAATCHLEQPTKKSAPKAFEWRFLSIWNVST
ncbi:hypothetical protein ACQ4M4_03280 [Leptolyngbya sp. AN02str]